MKKASLTIWILVGMAFDANASVRFYHADHLGSSSISTDESGTVVHTSQYYPFGETFSESTNGFVPIHKYTGQEKDEESKLYYYKARYYDADIGRFLSPDPAMKTGMPEKYITDPQQQNPYSYVRNNPMKYFDPTGNEPIGFDFYLATGNSPGWQNINAAEFREVMEPAFEIAAGIAMVCMAGAGIYSLGTSLYSSIASYESAGVGFSAWCANGGCEGAIETVAGLAGYDGPMPAGNMHMGYNGPNQTSSKSRSLLSDGEISEIAARTKNLGLEHGLELTTDGTRNIIKGYENGIDPLYGGELIGHSHPYHYFRGEAINTNLQLSYEDIHHCGKYTDNQTIISPDGQYIVWEKETNWWHALHPKGDRTGILPLDESSYPGVSGDFIFGAPSE